KTGATREIPLHPLLLTHRSKTQSFTLPIATSKPGFIPPTATGPTHPAVMQGPLSNRVWIYPMMGMTHYPRWMESI
ncbi:hypothetical protein EBZ35_05215, partial [bacterium]|nr:hypothetical protein [bacterium]